MQSQSGPVPAGTQGPGASTGGPGLAAPARISLEQAESQAIAAAKRRHRDKRDPAFALEAGRLTAVAGVLIYECTVGVLWVVKPAVISSWTGREKAPAEYARTTVRVQVDAHSGDVVGISD